MTKLNSFLTNHKADRVLYKWMCPALHIFFVIKNLERYFFEKSSHNNNILNSVFLQIFLLPAVMKLKTQIKISQKLVSELGRKYDGVEEFINIRVKELRLEHGKLKEEVRLFLCCVYSLVTKAVYNESFLH